jgi:hypothetical protein
MDLADLFRHRWAGRHLKIKRRPASQALAKRRLPQIESLENRALLTTFYVDNSLLLTADRDASGGLSPGDQVTFGNGQSYQQADLTYDAAPVDGDVDTAFSSIGQALASPLVQPGDTIEIAGGTYTEGGLTIDKSLTLQGEGNVVIAAPPKNTQAGLSVIDTPDRVAINNVSLQNSISDTGGGTLDLVDVKLVDGQSSINDVNQLNVVSASTTPQYVSIAQEVLFVGDGAAAATNSFSGLPDQLWINGGTSAGVFTFSGVQNVSFATPAGSQYSISVSPLPDATVTIDGNNSTTPGTPGDTLILPTNFDRGSSLSAAQDSTGISGTWTPTTGQPVHFAHLASLQPGIATQTVGPITGTEDADTGSQVVAKFTSPVVDAIAAGDTANVYWGDESSSTGTITYDSSTGIYSVLGSHTYTEGGDYAVSVDLKTPNGSVILPDSTATITPTTTPHLTPGPSSTIPLTVEELDTGAVGSFTDSVHLDPGAYSAEINWGDGSSSAGQIAVNELLWSFIVTGDHAYAQTGTDQIAVTVYRDGVAAGTLSATAVVSPAQSVIAYPAQSINATAGADTGNVMIAGFTDPAGNSALSAYSADIDWGDGTTSAGTTSSGTLRSQLDVLPPSVDRTFWQVYGSHAYEAPGTYSIDVTIDENGTQVAAVTSTATITPAATTTTTSTPEQRFVANIYHDLLGRTAEAAGLAYWSGQLDSGLTRGQFIADVQHSGEYLQDVVNSLYQHYLHRSAEPSVLGADVNLLAGGLTDEQLASVLVGSNEYFALHGGTNDGFLEALFEDTLQRPIDAGAKAALEQPLAGGVSRAQVAAVVFGSHEYHLDMVNSYYTDLLARPADPVGVGYWGNQLDTGTTDEQVFAAIAASDEFFNGPSS